MLGKQQRVFAGFVYGALTVTCLTSRGGFADTIVGYDAVNTPDGAPALDPLSGVTASDLIRGDGLKAGTGGTFNSSGWTDEATDYLEWGWTTSDPLNLTDLDLRYDRSASGPQAIDIRLSTNGNAYASIFTDDSVSTAGEDVLDIDLTSFTDVTSASFRLFGSGAASASGTFDIEPITGLSIPRGIVVNGTAAAVPEPAAIELASIGMIGAMMLRGMNQRHK